MVASVPSPPLPASAQAARHADGPLQRACQLVRGIVDAWLYDDAPSMGAAPAYDTLFSIAPMLLIVISVSGLVFSEEAARGEIFEQPRGLIGADGAAAVQRLSRACGSRRAAGSTP